MFVNVSMVYGVYFILLHYGVYFLTDSPYLFTFCISNVCVEHLKEFKQLMRSVSLTGCHVCRCEEVRYVNSVYISPQYLALNHSDKRGCVQLR